MEAAVSAYAANSKWCLGLGRRQMGGFGSSKQSLLLSLSIGGGGGGGCCNWSSRKRRINNMNCSMRRFRLESTSMGMGMASIERRQSLKGVRGEAASALGGGGGDVENGDVPEASIRVAMQKFLLGEVVSERGGDVENEAPIRVSAEVVENDSVIPFRLTMQQYVGIAASEFGGEVVENGDVIFPEASARVAMEYIFGEVISEVGGEVVENGNLKFTEASIRVAMLQHFGEAVSELGGEVVENGDILIYPGAAIRAIPAYIRVPMQYVRPVCVGLGGAMLGVGCYLAPKITNVVVKAAVMFGIPIAIMTLVHVKEFEKFKQVLGNSRKRERNRNSVRLAPVFKHVGLALLTGAMAMFQVGYFLMSYTSCSRITSALIALALMVFVNFLVDDTPPV